MQNRELSLHDLQADPAGQVPRIRDMDLAAALGFEDRHKIRELIRRRLEELAAHGWISATVAENTDPKGRGRPGLEYWLTEEQAVLICMWSRAANADAVRSHLVSLWGKWRRRAPAQGVAVSIPDIDQLPFLDNRERNRVRYQQGVLSSAANLINDIIAQAMVRGERERRWQAEEDERWGRIEAAGRERDRRLLEG